MTVRTSGLSIPIPNAIVATMTSARPSRNRACTSSRSRARHPRVVGHRAQVALQLSRERRRLLPRRRVDDGGAPRLVGEDLLHQLSPAARRHLGHLHREVRPAEAVDEAPRVHEAELRADVVLDARRRRRRQRDDRRGAQQREPRAEEPVVGAEIVPPVRDAVRLVDGDERRGPLGEHLGEARHREPLGGDEEEVELPGEVVEADLPRRGRGRAPSGSARRRGPSACIFATWSSMSAMRGETTSVVPARASPGSW